MEIYIRFTTRLLKGKPQSRELCVQEIAKLFDMLCIDVGEGSYKDQTTYELRVSDALESAPTLLLDGMGL